MSSAINLGQAAAFTSAGWLPMDSGIEWLDSLGADHRRLLAAQSEAMAAVSAARDGRERAMEQRREALALSVRADRESDIPDAATVERRASAVIEAAEERARATGDALRSFVTDAIAEIEEHAVEWLGLLSGRKDEAAEKRREAERLLQEAAAVEAGVWHLEEWVTRNAGLHQRAPFRNVPEARFLPWGHAQELSPPKPPRSDGQPEFVNPPSLPMWDADAVAARSALDKREFAARHAEQMRAQAEAEIASEPVVAVGGGITHEEG